MRFLDEPLATLLFEKIKCLKRTLFIPVWLLKAIVSGKNENKNKNFFLLVIVQYKKQKKNLLFNFNILDKFLKCSFFCLPHVAEDI